MFARMKRKVSTVAAVGALLAIGALSPAAAAADDRGVEEVSGNSGISQTFNASDNSRTHKEKEKDKCSSKDKCKDKSKDKCSSKDKCKDKNKDKCSSKDKCKDKNKDKCKDKCKDRCKEKPRGKVSLAKSADKTTVKPGETVTYTVKITNGTNVDRKGLTWSDNLTGVLIHADWGGIVNGDGASFDGRGTLKWKGDLAKGQSATVTYQVTVKDSAKAGKYLKNVVTSCDSKDKPHVKIPIKKPDKPTKPKGEINLTKAADKEIVRPGDIVTYSVTMANNTSKNQKNLSWSDDLSGVLMYADWGGIIEGQGATFNGRTTLSWRGNLAAGASATIKYQVTVKADAPAGRYLKNTVTSCNSKDKPYVQIPIEDAGLPAGDIDLTKTVDKDIVKPHELLTYTVTITNNTGSNAVGLEWADDLSEVLPYADWVGVASGDATYDAFAETLVWQGDLVAGESAVVTYQVLVKEGVAEGTLLRNSVTSGSSEDVPDVATRIESVD